MSLSVQKFGYDALKTYAGVIVSNNLKVQEKLGLGNSLIAGSLANGAVYASISDAINYFSGRGSRIMAGDMKEMGNDIIFFSGLSGAARATGVDGTLFETINRVSPLGQENNLMLVESGIVTAGRFLGDYINSSPQAPELLRKVRKPLNLIM
jgi:hypothetical protein